MKRGRTGFKSKCLTFSSHKQRAKRQRRVASRLALSPSEDWGNLPHQVVLQIFHHLFLIDRTRASSTCRRWNEVFHTPGLWRRFEFELNQPATSYLRPTHPDLIQQITKKHDQHLQYVSFKVDSCIESAEAACDILSQPVNCTSKTLGRISTARPSFMDVSQAHFVSALTVVSVNSKSLSSIKIDDTPVDDPSLKVLVANNRDTLKLLKMSSCPHVSPAGREGRSEFAAPHCNLPTIVCEGLGSAICWLLLFERQRPRLDSLSLQ